MKIFILIFLFFISTIELRRYDDDDDNNNIYELDDLLKNKYDRHKYRPNKQTLPDDDDDNDDDQYIPSSFEHKKVHPSRKKVLPDTEEPESDDTEDQLLPKTTHSNDLSETSTCLNKYNIRSEQLVKIKELKNGAHMIRYILLDKRTLPSHLNLKEHCMIKCCSEKTCDLAMLSEQPTHEGYKCYFFACNGSCPLASHRDYTIMVPKKDSVYDTKLAVTKIDDESTSTLPNMNISKTKSFFRETSVIIFLIFGLISTIVLFVFLFGYCRDSQKRGRKSKNYTVDADYLINGLYL